MEHDPSPVAVGEGRRDERGLSEHIRWWSQPMGLQQWSSTALGSVVVGVTMSNERARQTFSQWGTTWRAGRSNTARAESRAATSVSAQMQRPSSWWGWSLMLGPIGVRTDGQAMKAAPGESSGTKARCRRSKQALKVQRAGKGPSHARERPRQSPL